MLRGNFTPPPKKKWIFPQKTRDPTLHYTVRCRHEETQTLFIASDKCLGDYDSSVTVYHFSSNHLNASTEAIFTSPLVRVQSIAVSVSVCPSVCLCACMSQQELIRRWDSERELLLLRNAPRMLPISLQWRKITTTTPLKVIQGHRFWYLSKAHMRLPISD